MEQTPPLSETQNGEHKVEEEAQAAIDIWKYAFGFTEMAVVKCAIDLEIADVIENNGGSISLSELSSSLKCPPDSLFRIMRFLVNRKFFTQSQTSLDGALIYTQTPLSRRLLRNGKNSFDSLILLESSPIMLAPWLGLSNRVVGRSNSVFEAAHGKDLWSYAADNSSHSKLINDGVACIARVVVPQVVRGCPNLLDGVGTLVDVGGGNGTALSMLVEAFPWIRGINLDLPHVVSEAPVYERVEHVGGNMFVDVPKADAVYIMRVMHDWGDDECIEILKKCKEAIPKDKGKVIIVDAVIEENTEDKFEDVKIMLDMAMMAQYTNGKERTLKEWKYVLELAGFSHFTIKPIQAVQSVIEAYP